MLIKDIAVYDGDILHNRFAYKYFKEKTLPIGNIIAFVAPMKVEAAGMIDQEDVNNNDFIYSDLAVNFLWELPYMNAFGAVCFQRLLNTQIATILTKIINAPIEVDGDDLMVHKEFIQHGIIQQKGKCSVSITHVKQDAALGHTGININAGKKAPAFAYSTNMNEQQTAEFINAVINMFYNLTDDIFLATTKIIAK
jgi:hypothetical protein